MPHHRPKYKDMWWSELPEEAIKAATVLGWDTKEKWDESVDVPYRTKPFQEMTLTEKRAAIFLQCPLFKDKLDIYWSETDPETKKAALALDWTQHKWDHDWELWHLDVEHKYWKELTDEQKAGAMHFGYTHHTWDEDLVEVFAGGEEEAPPAPLPPLPAEEEAAAAEEVEDIVVADDPEEEPEEVQEAKAKKNNFRVTRLFGGSGGKAFDHGNHRRIYSISVYANRKNVDGIVVTYENKVSVKNGGGDKGDTMELADGEYINKIEVRADEEVQCLTFHTNKGNKLGPCGGKGGLLNKGGDEFVLRAPKNMKLCGVKGQAGSRLDAIAFRWGPRKTES